MLASEIRRIAGRRGTYWSAIIVGLGAVNEHASKIGYRPVDLGQGMRRRRHRRSGQVEADGDT